MKRKLIALMIVVVWLMLQPVGVNAQQNPDAFITQAEQAYAKKEYARSAELFMAATKLQTDDSGLFYNAACACALAGRKNDAFDLLNRALKLGYGNSAQLKQDTDFQSLREDPRWQLTLDACARNEKRLALMWNNPALQSPYRENLSEDEKIAGLSKLWAEVKFNFANFDLVPDLDWDKLYLAYLPKVRQTKSTDEYYRVLAELVAQLKDGHTNLSPPNELALQWYAVPALSTRMIEDRVMVRRVWDPQLVKAGIQPGLEILEINGMPVKAYAEKFIQPYVAASTPQDAETRLFSYELLRGPVQQALDLTFRTESGETFKKSVSRLNSEQWAALKLPPSPILEFKVLESNVGLLVLNSFNDAKIEAEFAKILPQLMTTDALIIDVRNNGGGNSGYGWNILAHLTDKPFKTSMWRTRMYRPSFRAWGRGESWHQGQASEVAPLLDNPYVKPVVVLISPRTFSAAEDFAVAFDAMKRGTLIGEPTGGSTGQPLNIQLPGGGGARICTKRDSYPDGREFVGVGIQPQILVKPNLADFRADQDRVLLTALDEVKRLRQAAR